MSYKRDDFQSTIAGLARTPGELASLLRDLPEEAIRSKNSPDEFSALENVCHLRDIEVEGYTVRINKILTDNKPVLADIDGGRLAIERAYNNQNVAAALESFALARKQNIDLLIQINEEQVEQTGFLIGVGEITLDKLFQMMLEHDEGHLEDLRRIRQQWLRNSSTAA